jgi:heterodisulfide reductase subunit A
MSANDKNQAVLVVGAGIAGMAAGMHLAELGHLVYLLDTAPAIGGSMHLLDHTFPTNSCGICLMLPHQPALCPTLECDRHERVRLLPLAELVGLQGEPGAFTATVRHKARYVDVDKCTGCGDCDSACPESRPHDHEGWLSPTKAIYRPPGLRAVPDAWVIDMEACTRCGACVDACPTGAIDLEMEDCGEEIEVGAVLLTPGFAPFDARVKGEYGYGVYDNVLSALEFERMVSLAGWSVAHMGRPSDGKAPRKVAFVHCVGSRDNLCGAGYCSSACCMYTAKQVALAKQLDPELEATIFFMDLRAFGKDSEAYIEGVQALPGVTYRRAMPSSVHQLQQTKELVLSYAGEDGRWQEEAFDLVVLAIGFAPPEGMQVLAREMGVKLNEYGFAATDGYHPMQTARPGVFVAGAFREPKDIPETVTEAAGAAAEVASSLHEARDQAGPESRIPNLESPIPNPQPRDVSDEEPKVGLFVCQCNGDLAPVGVAEVVDWAQELPGVAVAQVVEEGCSARGRAAIQATIEKKELNRVVVAGCSHRLFADEFEAMMRGVGLDPRLLARVNLREQVVYPHQDNGSGVVRSDLTAKAQSLVGMAIARLRAMAGVEALSVGASQKLTRRAVVVGGGAAGMTAALELARLGIPVELVERESELGGQWRHIRYQTDGSDPQAALAALLEQVMGNEAVRLHLEAEVKEFVGTPGSYRSVIASNGREETVEHGVLIVTTGGKPAATTEYLYGQHPHVLTQRELEQLLADPSPQSPISKLQAVVMIQCTGSREPSRPYCSRVCCTQAVKNALKLKELKPELDVYVLYREVRTYGFREAYYQAARDAGVVFLRYELQDAAEGTHKPQVEARGDRLRVTLTEPVTGQATELNADMLVLSVGIDAEEEGVLAETLGVGLNGDGFFQEEHAKMKPLDLGKGGAYVAGLAHSPRFLDETLAQAQGAAMRAAAFLAPEEVVDRPTSVWVNERLCSFCGLCVEACPFAARVMNYDSRVADVDYALCQGCGVCAMVCPNKATLQKAFEHRQLMAAIDMALV